jgi:hypothetical protein
MREIICEFPITDLEFQDLDKKFSKLCWHAAHELKHKNSNNNLVEDAEDIKQELQMSMLRAGSYYKRQVYIEKCFEAVNRHAKDKFVVQIVQQLQKLWENRTRHGANRLKYGKFQERLLDKLVSSIVPKHERPDKSAPLNLDAKFATYCKAIVWNGQKSMGKKITREKAIRSGMVSLSEYDYLQSGQG